MAIDPSIHVDQKPRGDMVLTLPDSGRLWQTLADASFP